MTDDTSRPSVHDYVMEYEFRGDQDYTPNEHEQTIIEDAIEGYLASTVAPPLPDREEIARPGRVTVEEAFELGFCWRGTLVGQALEDSRAVGRTLQSDLFAKLPIDLKCFNSFQSADLGIVEAKKRILSALREPGTTSSPPAAVRESVDSTPRPPASAAMGHSVPGVDALREPGEFDGVAEYFADMDKACADVATAGSKPATCNCGSDCQDLGEQGGCRHCTPTRAGAEAAVPLFSEQGLGSKLLAAAEAYIADYVYDYDGAADHEPTEFERDMLSNMVNGLFGDDAFSTLLNDAATSPPAQAALTYDEQVEMLRLADDLAGGEKTELDTQDMCVVISALRAAAGTNRDALVEALPAERDALSADLSKVQGELDAEWKRGKVLVEALRPFAKEAEKYNDIPGIYRCHDNVELWQKPNYHTKLCVGDLRAARAALSQEAPDAGVGSPLLPLEREHTPGDHINLLKAVCAFCDMGTINKIVSHVISERGKAPDPAEAGTTDGERK